MKSNLTVSEILDTVISNGITRGQQYSEGVQGANTIISDTLRTAERQINELIREEELLTLQWVLNQCTFTDGEVDQKYIEDRIAHLKQTEVKDE